MTENKLKEVVNAAGPLRTQIGLIASISAAAFMFGGSATAATFALRPYQDVPDSLAAHREWQVHHDTAVMKPGLERIRELEVWRVEHDAVAARMASQVNRLYCVQFPNDCQPVIRSQRP